eukprot:COSAG02_NODE_5457_length_4302_cov_2.364977_5_plen_98_part_00
MRGPGRTRRESPVEHDNGHKALCPLSFPNRGDCQRFGVSLISYLRPSLARQKFSSTTVRRPVCCCNEKIHVQAATCTVLVLVLGPAGPGNVPYTGQG